MGDTKWLIGLAIIFATLTFFAQVMQGTYFPDSQITTFQTAIQTIQGMDAKNFLGIVTNFFSGCWSFVVAIRNMFTWNYSFFEGGFAIIKWVVLVPATAILFLSLAISVRNSA